MLTNSKKQEAVPFTTRIDSSLYDKAKKVLKGRSMNRLIHEGLILALFFQRNKDDEEIQALLRIAMSGHEETLGGLRG